VRRQCATTCHWEPRNHYTNPVRDCKECHIDGTWVPIIDMGRGVGNLGNPHHNTQLAGSGQCTACHKSSLVSDLNAAPVPQFDPTTITPTPVACENCHWPSGNAPEGPPPLADWSEWTGFPKPTTFPDSLPHPAPIEANGQATTGSVVASDPAPTANKPFTPTTGTHHEIDGLVYLGHCDNCHATSGGSDYNTDPTLPLSIRGCENCHDIYTLHGEMPGYASADTLNFAHTVTMGGPPGLGYYNVGGTLNQIVTGNQKCVACHGDVITRPMPVDPGVAPQINHLEPPMASAGVKVTIFNQQPGPNFGDKGPYDSVMVGTVDGDPTSYKEAYVVSWNSDKIQAVIPGGFAIGNLYVRVVKKYWVEILGDGIGNDNGTCDPGENCALQQRASGSALFIMRYHPVLTTLVPDSGTWGTTITINALPGSFYKYREEVFNGPLSHEVYPASWNTFGYSTYVELVASNDKYRATSMTASGWPTDGGLGAWSDTSIKIHLNSITVGGNIVGNLLDVNTNNPVPLADLYKGNWQLYVVTDYFKDDGDGMYMLHQGGSSTGHLLGKIDTGDTLLWREVSDPLPWFSTDTPYISSIRPFSVKSGNLFAIYGINFGTTQDTSYVKAGACGTDPSTWPFIFPGTPASAQVYQWANTRVVLRAPTVGSNKTGCLRVDVPKVLAPGSVLSNESQAITVYP